MKRMPIISIAAMLLSAAGLVSAYAASETNRLDRMLTDNIAQSKSPVKITADRTFHDRKEGVIVFTGHVSVSNEEYQICSDRASVFLSPSNDVSSLVAVGSVALTNGFRRAYASKTTFRRDKGLVVLYGEEGKPAEISDEKNEGEFQRVRGKKIRFWINQEQVEVLEADIVQEGRKKSEEVKVKSEEVRIEN